MVLFFVHFVVIFHASIYLEKQAKFKRSVIYILNTFLPSINAPLSLHRIIEGFT